MQNLKGILRSMPILGRGSLLISRARKAFGSYWAPLTSTFKWLFKSNEITNFTYDLEPTNLCYLASLVADITGVEYHKVMTYVREIEEDEALHKHVADITAKSDFSHSADATARFGRRIGWYVFARILKPKIVVETGIDKGLGACVLTSALKKNKEEGFEGMYYGTDINPAAGYLLTGEYAKYGQILYGDSIETLEKFDGLIDLFINDSDHSEDYEAAEYRTIANKLSERAIILGDNSHYTDKLLEFSLQTNRHFVFFQEKPLDHWYPGAGIGISFKR